MALPLAKLQSAGFEYVGRWVLDPSMPFGVRIDGEGPIAPGVYAHTVDEHVRYVGAAHDGLRKRLRHYQITERKRTAYRIRSLLIEAMSAGAPVSTLALVPDRHALEWRGLPIDMIHGIEEGLIRAFRPDWNLRGKGRKRTRLAEDET